ncbi:M15 family metallopeptidase [Piscirickettsia litoralis]|uniref:D-alanyl-D-alanine carboxypeptidase n=1 Tax=Piscirickettsia litoralis TaxID=1891921 RepID=A0ABX3A470_9GAMM|nr:M15 family metallopeptidase [Piscirickettsia litoralis]ODN42170.1 D-alanyl-D-alanine carboxypeptidase [Piscirickettsia litoralis]
MTAHIYGQDDQYLTDFNSDHRLHIQAKPPLLSLIEAASHQGIHLALISAYRSFDRQLVIWNAKASGEKPVFDRTGQHEIKLNELAPKERVFAILNWFALPGTSRHHWGTDFDIFDLNARPQGYHIQLVPSEYQSGGVFSSLGEWLDQNLDHTPFFRPFWGKTSGVAKEPWHISYQPLAEEFQQSFCKNQLATIIKQSPILLKDEILAALDEIVARFVHAIDD